MFSEDENINVADAVAIVGWIIDCNGSTARTDVSDATSVVLTQTSHELRMTGDGTIGGVQMVLSHADNFELNLTGSAMIANYHTEGNYTTIFVINPTDELLFTSNGEYKIEDVIVAGADGEIGLSIVEGKPTEFKLGDAYPNPFNPSVSLDLEVSETGFVSVRVFNLVGQVVSVLNDGILEADYHSFTWNAAGQPSGIYVIRVETINHKAAQKVMLVK